MKTIQTETNNLTPKQRRIIPILVSSRNKAEARKAAGVCQETVWRWMKNPAFKKELDNTRDQFINEALERLKSAVTRAVDVLAETMTGTDATLKVRAAGMVQDYFFRVKEIQEFEKQAGSLSGTPGIDVDIFAEAWAGSYEPAALGEIIKIARKKGFNDLGDELQAAYDGHQGAA